MYTEFQGSMKNIALFKSQNVNRFLLIDTAGCKIPKLDPFDSSIYWYMGSASELKCEVKKDLLYTKNNVLFINWPLVKYYVPSLRYCKYDVIWRPANVETHNNYFQYINESQPFTTNQTISDEFIRVRCFNDRNEIVYSNAFSFVHLKRNVEKRCRENELKQTKDKTILNILMIGVDSVSRNNMIRYMPKTRNYLLQKMSALEFLGYNKVADNTFLNIVPMTTGKFVHELPWNASLVNVTFDKYDFIWNKFSRKGYRTLYSEDSPYGQIFDYQKAGFSKPQADYFDRPFSLAMEEMADIWNSDHHCIHARPETDIVLEYTRQFIQKFKKSLFFSFTFVTRLTHDKISDASRADQLYTKFLKSINSNSTLNNTILIFFSDHGIRFGKVRQTYIGKIEERLPFLFFVLPNWFKNRFPNFYKSLYTNRNRLITPFDIFKTLKHLMDIQNYSNEKGRGLSILREISLNRTCENADILPHWCTCATEEHLSITDEVVIEVANKFTEKLNEKLADFKQCEILKLKKVISATKIIPSDDILKYIKTSHVEDKHEIKFGDRVSTYIDYQLMLQTSPGDGMFEGTVRYDEFWKSINMMGDFSRINIYGKTSHCVDGIQLKKICYCKKQII